MHEREVSCLKSAKNFKSGLTDTNEETYMDNFTFFNPTRIEFGTGKEQLIGQVLTEYGVKKILFCYGSDRIKRDGLFAIVTNSLNEHGVQFVECSGIVSNPVISKVREAITMAREHQVNAVLSVGGAGQSWTVPKRLPQVLSTRVTCGICSAEKEASMRRCPFLPS